MLFQIYSSDGSLKKRDDFRKKSVIAPACIKQISGLGKHSYLEGVKELISL